jgi:hypothetical protein
MPFFPRVSELDRKDAPGRKCLGVTTAQCFQPARRELELVRTLQQDQVDRGVREPFRRQLHQTLIRPLLPAFGGGLLTLAALGLLVAYGANGARRWKVPARAVA